MTDEIYSSDAPLDDSGKDEFHRWSFSQRVAQVIARRKDPSSITIGIYGTWGSGKTTVLNFIKQELREHDHVVSLVFNPWRFSDEVELLNQFFIEVASAIEKSLYKPTEKIGNLIRKYGSGIATVAEGSGAVGASGVAALLSKIGKKPDLDDLRKRIGAALIQAEKRVVILVDDIDRMDRNEIQALFRLVKLTADFRNTAYVLAFDEDVVASALQEKYDGERSGGSGRSFLEKIIQIPLHLPAVDAISLRIFCFAGVDQALVQAEIELSEEQEQEFVRHFVDGFESRLHTPRKARLYGNTLAFSLPVLKNEVNTIDHMLIEGVRIFYPDLYKVIRSNPDVFLKGLSDRGSSDVKQEKINAIIESGVTDLNNEEKEAAKHLLTVLFPRTKSILGNMTTYDHSWDETWAKEQKIASSHYFNRYFSYCVPKGDFPDQLISEHLTSLVDLSPEVISKSIAAQIDHRNVESFVFKLKQRASLMGPQESEKLAVSLALIGNCFPNPEEMMSFTTTFSQAGTLISQLIANIQSKEDRLQIAKQIVTKAATLPFALECYRWLRPSKEDAVEEGTFTEEDVKVIAEDLAIRIRKEAKSATPFFVEQQKHASFIFYVWRNTDGQQVVESYIRKHIDADPLMALRLLECFLGTSWGMENGLSHRGDFERDQYDSVKASIDPTFILKTLESLFGDQLELSEQYPRFGEDFSDGLKLALQFTWIHRSVMSEQINKKT